MIELNVPIYTMEHYSPIKKNKTLSFDAKCMKLEEDVVLSKISQTQQMSNTYFLSYVESKEKLKNKAKRDESGKRVERREGC